MVLHVEGIEGGPRSHRDRQLPSRPPPSAHLLDSARTPQSNMGRCCGGNHALCNPVSKQRNGGCSYSQHL